MQGRCALIKSKRAYEVRNLLICRDADVAPYFVGAPTLLSFSNAIEKYKIFWPIHFRCFFNRSARGVRAAPK